MSFLSIACLESIRTLGTNVSVSWISGTEIVDKIEVIWYKFYREVAVPELPTADTPSLIFLNVLPTNPGIWNELTL